jgi:hypothetical protein
MACKNTNKYLTLSSVSSSNDDKRMVFRFESGNSFEWSIVDQKFYHSDTQKEFANIHFKNIVWGEEIKPGKRGFFRAISKLAKEGWTKNFLFILSKWIDDRISSYERNEKRSVRYSNSLNRLDTMENKDVVFSIESLAKNNFIQEMNLERVCRDAFRGDKVRSFKEIKEDGLDNWFLSRAGLRPNARYLRNEHTSWANEDIYEDPNRQYVLGNYVESYRMMNKNEMVDIFRYVWETYNYSFCFSHYGFSSFKNRLSDLAKHGYEYKRLMDYIFRDLPEQGISASMVSGVDLEQLNILVDYVRMSSEMNRDFEKYPRYLKTAHDIAMKNYKVKQSQTLILKYEKIVENLKNMEFKNDKYCIVAPPTLQSIVQEGSALHHCVASYIDRVVEGQTTIMFLRTVEEPETSLVTVELRNKTIGQARGHSNRNINKEESDFLEEYKDWLENKSKQKELELEMV